MGHWMKKKWSRLCKVECPASMKYYTIIISAVRGRRPEATNYTRAENIVELSSLIRGGWRLVQGMSLVKWSVFRNAPGPQGHLVLIDQTHWNRMTWCGL